jgi:putative heme-binding domain-containing protein
MPGIRLEIVPKKRAMSLHHRSVASWALLAAVFVVTALAGRGALLAQAAQDQHGVYAEADIAYGAQLYAAQCSMCHGPNGDQVGTVDLRSGRFRNASTDQQLSTLIRTGIKGTGMPAFAFDSAELTGIVAFLRNMRTFNAAAVPIGDAARGRALFEGKAECTKCHRTDGRGAGLAPDLADVGSIRTAAALQAVLVDPSAAMQPINRPVRAVTRDGRTITGRRLNEDTYTVQVITDQGRLASLVKSDLREYTVLTISPMPAYKGKLSSAEMADVVAYLLSLK